MTDTFCFILCDLLKNNNKEHGMGKKSSDIWIIPLHSALHDALHKNGNEVWFFVNHGLAYDDVKERALYLASISPDQKIRRAVREYLTTKEQ